MCKELRALGAHTVQAEGFTAVFPVVAVPGVAAVTPGVVTLHPPSTTREEKGAAQQAARKKRELGVRT